MPGIKLEGGPFDGATLPFIGWIEAIVLSNETGLHWYVYVGPPEDLGFMHDGYLVHTKDETLMRVREQRLMIYGLGVGCLADEQRRIVNCMRRGLAKSLEDELAATPPSEG
jgi:hypothetical protein